MQLYYAITYTDPSFEANICNLIQRQAILEIPILETIMIQLEPSHALTLAFMKREQKGENNFMIVIVLICDGLWARFQPLQTMVHCNKGE